MSKLHIVLTLAAALLLIPVAAPATDDENCDAAPEFTTKTIDDQEIALADLRGEKPVYLKFWLSTCPQCIEEMPHFVHTYEQYGDSFQFIAVNLATDGDTTDIVRRAMLEHGLEMPMVFDDSGDLGTKFGVFGTPTHILIDQNGRIVHTSNAANEELDAKLNCLHSRLD